MRLGSMALLVVGAAAGFAAAQRLLSEAPLPERLPEEARVRLEGARGRLRRYRESAKDGLVEARREREAAAEELMRQYHALTERIATTDEP